MWWILIVMQAAVAGSPEEVPREKPTPPMPYPAAITPTPGSLWSESQARMLVGLDGNARSVGDLVTVIISESASTQVSVGTTTSSSTDNQAGVSLLFGIEKGIASSNDNLKDGLGLETSSNFGFSGSGDTSRKGSVDGVLTCSVIEVLPNGNLRIMGHKKVRSNFEDQFLVLEGIVRPQDIQADNTVNSALLAESTVQINGSGVLSDDQKTRVGTRAAKKLWPF